MNPNEQQPEPKDTNQIIPLNAPSPAPLSEATPPTDSRRRIVLTDAQGNIVGEPTPQQYIVTPFPDGTVFRYMAHPQKPNTFLLIDSSGTAVAAASSLGVAQILVQGAMMWLVAAMQQAAAKNTRKVDETAKPGDTAANENKN